MTDLQAIQDAIPMSELASALEAAPITTAAAEAEAVDYGPFEAVTVSAAGGGDLNAGLERLHDVPVELTVEIGRTHMTIGETLGLGPGSIVSLERLAGEPVDLLVNGKRIAYGEVVVIDEEFGLRITELVESPGRSGGSAADDVPGFTASA